jgi:hypothetical protein
MTADYREKLYRLVFGLAAIYNFAFGLWACLWPRSFFDSVEIASPNYPALWSCLGMVIGLYGILYAYAAYRIDRAAPIISVGLAGKILGPIGWLMVINSGEWPLRTFTLIVFNDLIWWLPFGLFLLDETRSGKWLRRIELRKTGNVHRGTRGVVADGLGDMDGGGSEPGSVFRLVGRMDSLDPLGHHGVCGRDVGSSLRFARRIAFHRLVARSNRNSRIVWLAAYWRCGERSLHDRWRHSYSRHAFSPRGVAHLGMGNLDERLRVNGLHHDRQRDRHGNFDDGVDVVALPVGCRIRLEITARVSQGGRGLNAASQFLLRRLFFVPLLTLTFPSLQIVSALRGEPCAGSHLLFPRSCRNTKRFRL